MHPRHDNSRLDFIESVYEEYEYCDIPDSPKQVYNAQR